jgi:hypothetical protein
MRKIYKTIVIFFILFSGISHAYADETEWVDPQEKTLRLTETFTRAGFLIEATDFYDNSALLTVYDSNRNVITKNITRINDYIEVDKSLNITVIKLEEVSGNISAGHGLNVIVDQWVRIETRIAGSPSPKISIISKAIVLNNKTIVRRIFIPGSEIAINFSVRNDGKAKLKRIYLKINTSLPVLYGDKLDYEIFELGAGNESEVITVRFGAPSVEQQQFFLISAEARGNDIFDRVYRAGDSINIEVNPQTGRKIDIKKYVSEKIYFGDIAVVSLSIKNNLSQATGNISLMEFLPAGLGPLDPNLTWTFSLGPQESKLISYKVRPEKPGTYYLQPGSSVIEYRDELYYNFKLVKLIVNGPYVVLMKSASPDTPGMGENITVRLEARNIGDSNAIVRLNDSVPENYSLPSKDYFPVLNTLVLHPGDSKSFSYEINVAGPGDHVIPPAKATVLDQFLYQDERYEQKITSNNLTIRVRESTKLETPPVKIITPVETTVPESSETPAVTTASLTPEESPGFQWYILTMIFLFILILKKRES